MTDIHKESRMRAFFIILFFSIVFAVIVDACRPENPLEERAKQESREKSLKKIQAKDAVRMLLKDPDSAQFKSLSTARAGYNWIVCGQVNSKNGFGAYTGYQHFISNGTDLTYLEEQMKDFYKVWNEFCVHQ